MVEGKISKLSCHQEMISERNGEVASAYFLTIRSESLTGPEGRHFRDPSEEAG